MPPLVKLLTFALSAHFVVSQFTYSFPDCADGPLAGTGVCDTALDPRTRAESLVELFTPEELLNNTVNRSPGVSRIGLPPYEWWSEALVRITFLTALESDSILSAWRRCEPWCQLQR